MCDDVYSWFGDAVMNGWSGICGVMGSDLFVSVFVFVFVVEVEVEGDEYGDEDEDVLSSIGLT